MEMYRNEQRQIDADAPLDACRQRAGFRTLDECSSVCPPPPYLCLIFGDDSRGVWWFLILIPASAQTS